MPKSRRSSAQSAAAPASTSPTDVESRPSFLLHRVNAGLARVSNPLFREYGLDLITSRILVLVFHRPGIYVGDIVDVMCLPQSTVSHQVKRLEHRGYITRTQDEEDNRSYRVTLTGRGREVALDCEHRSAYLNDLLTSSMSEAEARDFLQRLAAMHTLLSELGPLKLDGLPSTRRASGNTRRKA